MPDGYKSSRRETPDEREASLLEKLRDAERKIRARKPDTHPKALSTRLGDVERHVESVVSQLLTLTVMATSVLGVFDRSRQRQFTEYRNLQWIHGVSRQAKKPDPLDTILLAMVFMLGEGGATAAMMIADGKMTIIEGVSYGMIFALATIVVGLVTGYLPGRRLAYKLRSPEPMPSDILIRGGALFGFVLGIGVEALLILTAARVRALGGHEHIFNFDEVGFWATFNDGIAVIICIIVLVSAILAIWKGLSGLSDVIPGFTQARHDAEDGVNELAAEAIQDAVYNVEDTAGAAIDDIDVKIDGFTKALAETPSAIAAWNDLAQAHNNAVQADKDHLNAANQRTSRAKSAINGRPCRCPGINEAAFNALLIDPVNSSRSDVTPNAETSIETLKALVDRLAAARDNAIAEIHAAHAEYFAGAPTLDVFPEFGGSDD